MNITDLTGTTWKIKENPNVWDYTITARVTFTNNGRSYYTYFLVGYWAGVCLGYGSSTTNFKGVCASYKSGGGYWRNGSVPFNDASTDKYTTAYELSPWTVITFTGGNDVKNGGLINWLKANATLVVDTFSIADKKVLSSYIGDKKILKAYMGDDVNPFFETEIISNFTLSDGDYLVTSDAKIFNVEEE